MAKVILEATDEGIELGTLNTDHFKRLYALFDSEQSKAVMRHAKHFGEGTDENFHDEPSEDGFAVFRIEPAGSPKGVKWRRWKKRLKRSFEREQRRRRRARDHHLAAFVFPWWKHSQVIWLSPKKRRRHLYRHEHVQ